jgi:hypothetical protein
VKIVIFVVALVFESASIAFACSGTDGYPKAVKALEKSQYSSAEQKALLMNDLMVGVSMHDDGHKTGDMTKMGQSLQILQSLQPKITN